ncbi:MAG: ribosome-associated translation inhibitor RaiA [Streptococcaceae bacterium]|nr:ribosome-associated translation inhibitor RaiA [Streptococcaceae bacterium]
MFKYNIRGENIEVTKAIRDYIEKRIDKLKKYFNDVKATVHVNLKIYTEKTAKVEVTIPLPHLVLRAENTSPDLYASADLVVDKLERQIRKYKTKVNRKHRKNKPMGKVFSELVLDEKEEVNELEIVRVKRIFLKPMDSEEAVLQMNMLSHDFFVYLDAKTQAPAIIYRRSDGKYGLIETE